MTAMTNIKQMITKRSVKASKPNIEKKNALKAALNAANQKQEVADKIEAIAISQDIESQMERDISREINIEFNLNFDDKDKTPNSVDLNGNAIPLSIGTNVDEKSENVLELQRKQDAMQSMHLEMQQGAATLEALAKKSEQLTEYLIKSEVELGRLEDIEKRYVNLHKASEALAKEHRELKLKLEEKYKQVNLLEGQKHKTRDILDKSQLEINRLSEQNKAQAADMNSQDIIIAKLKDENLNSTEQNGLFKHEIAELNKQNSNLQNKIELIQNEYGENEKLLSKANLKIDTLSRENEQTAIESLDIQARHASLNEKYAETASSLEEVKYELSSERSSFDEKLRLKDARIMKMERKIEVLTRQVSLTEQMVSEITDEKTSSLSNKLKEMKQPYCKNQKANGKTSKVKFKEVSAAV